ncbi:MAG: hypothetical protein WC455_27050 [Dehalococcoidia bacterium]|jgi:hypothetical protein
MEPTKNDNGHDLDWAVAHLADARQRHEAAKAKLDAAKAAWEAEHAAEIAETAQLKVLQERYDQVVRDQALEVFQQTGNNKPHAATEVKMWDVPQYAPNEAFNWCRSNMPALLVLDEAAYEKILRAVRASKTLTDTHLATMPGQVIEQPKVSISRNLTAYVPAPMIAEDEPIPAVLS